MDNKEFPREDFDRFADWWLAKREYAKKIANALCNKTIYDIFILTGGRDSDSDELHIGYTYYEYSDDNCLTTGYFPIDYLFDPDAIYKATVKRDEEKRQAAIRREQGEREEGLNRMEQAKAEYERLKAKYETK